ncbi:MAG: hypothetical protein ACHP78_03865 [Terriglobales bacterium]
MEFRLIYRGALPAQGSGKGGKRRKEKHAIRREFHRQLKELWNQNPFLRKRGTGLIHVEREGVVEKHCTRLELIAEQYQVNDFSFVPLINEAGGLACSLHILFLRRDNPGHLIESGGDIDNRIKVLFDALRKPDGNEIRHCHPAEDEKPFHCLLENDVLVSEVSVTTDRLLLPQEPGEDIHAVMLIVQVKTIIADMEKAYIEFLA